MTRQINQAGLALITGFETCTLSAILPTANDVWTIGWGHTEGVQQGDTCTQDQADAWLRQDLAWAELTVSTHTVTPLTDNEFAALVSLVYNIGCGNFDGSTLLRDLNAADLNDAAAQFLVWDKQRGIDLPGLDVRRQSERTLFLTPDDNSGA